MCLFACMCLFFLFMVHYGTTVVVVDHGVVDDDVVACGDSVEFGKRSSVSSHHASELRCIRISSASSLLLLSLYYCCYWCYCYSILLCSIVISVFIIITFMYIDLPLFEVFPGR